MRHNVPWEMYVRDAIASAAHFLGYEGRWRFLPYQPGPASSLVNAEGQNKYQEWSLWISKWFLAGVLVRIKYQNSKLLIIKWYFPFLTSLALPLAAFPASIKDTMENLPIICIGLVQGFPSSMIYAHFYNQQYHTTTLLKISIYKVSKKEDSCCNPPLKMDMWYNGTNQMLKFPKYPMF